MTAADEDLVLSAEQIQAGVAAVAARLNDRFAGQDVVVITVVPGGILFTADLVRQLTFDVSMDVMACPHTPGARHNDSPIVYHPTVSPQHRHVLLLDDAIESGGTMQRLVEHLQLGYQCLSLSVATLLVKPGRVDIPVPQYHAFEMDNDDLLVGYGLPWEDRRRNQPFVSRLKV
ncbi:hypoxanthine phosphoribosyltransferase [Natronospirillum operosum]|uniref:Hypoxanthine phosphoribosyltransferase n=1 Tax=Natronospirillum operosum TaxID=2759953 RepID=A0A4Z0W956_9GAMM|nr:phosphoribosyltransferase family protein [Natronospirillum operosum]TGG90631.1 hypoxanthine phosphoribosyltransferase [Natronospirillum operosum]